METTSPPTVRNSQYVALCLLNLMPEGWDDERTPRARCRDARRGQPLREDKALGNALRVLREMTLPTEPPEFVRRWKRHQWPGRSAPWEVAPWEGDYWMWQLDVEASHWDERLADNAGRFGRGRQVWWAYAELWVTDIAIRWAVAEMLPAPIVMPLTPFAEALEQRSMAVADKPARETLLHAAREQRKGRGNAPSDDAISSWTSDARTPGWESAEWISQQIRRAEGNDEDRGLVRAIMLESALSLSDPETRDHVAVLKERFKRVYEATRTHGFDAPHLREYAIEHRTHLLVEAAIKGSGTIGFWIVAEHVADSKGLEDLRDDLVAVSVGLSRWPERLLSKLGASGPTADQRKGSSAMNKAIDLLTHAYIIGCNADMERYPEWKDRPLLVMSRPPRNAEIKKQWEEALRLCKQEIDDEGQGRDHVDGGWVPYAVGYAIMFGLGMEPREMWRKEAIRRGGNGADPKLHPRESFKPGGRSDVAQCFWLKFSFEVG